jgi:phage anti-repressor protein
MEEFLKQFSTIPHQFITDFFVIAKEEYSENELVINFEIVYNWLNVRKDHLKEILIVHFEEDYDYILEKKKKEQINSTGLTTYHEIFITPNCFKELCMISNTAKAKEVRKYFIEMEKLIKRYYEIIKENMYKEIGLLKTNQKPKVKVIGGIVYIIKALNINTNAKKLGKSEALKERIAVYNTGNANDNEPEFILPVNDVHAVERCVKASVKQFQYRKRKEIFEMDSDILAKVIEKCDEISQSLQKYYNLKKEETTNKLQRMKTEKNKYYIFFVVLKNDRKIQSKSKNKSKNKSKIKSKIKSKNKEEKSSADKNINKKGGNNTCSSNTKTNNIIIQCKIIYLYEKNKHMYTILKNSISKHDYKIESRVNICHENISQYNNNNFMPYTKEIDHLNRNLLEFQQCHT